MIILLTLFGLLCLLAPLLTRLLGPWVFAPLAGMPLAATVWLLFQAPVVLDGGVVVEGVEWIPQLGIELSFRLDALSWLMALIVSGVGALVLLYCSRYFSRDEPGLGRFAAFLLAFAGVMFGLVTSDDILVMFVFWEATSVLSYLLIGHYTNRRESRGAALQALIVTTFGGLAMLVGVIILISLTGTGSLAAIVAAPPALDDPLAITAVMLILAGALSKSALVPFHFWLPAAMAAPTPVSAYLHAAAMVKAGIYLVARLAPGFAEMPGWRGVLVCIGVWTMLVGGWRSLRQYDLKLILAHGTVSQLGFLTVVVGYGTRDVALAGLTLLLAHALFKATLFLVVGVVDKLTGTRDWRQLSGLGRRQPVLAVIGFLGAASMAGLPPLFGFVAKEAVFGTLLAAAQRGSGWAALALIGAVLGSVLTVAYSIRFFWGAFWSKASVPDTEVAASRFDFLLAPALMAAGSLVLGFIPQLTELWFLPYADALPGAAHYHLALWHGFEMPLAISLGVFTLGGVIFWQRRRIVTAQAKLPQWVDMSRSYWQTISGIDRFGLWSTTLLQRGGLPGYLAVILVVFVATPGYALLANRSFPDFLIPWDYELQPMIALIMIAAAFFAARAGKRITAVLLVGLTGYGLVTIFAFHGAPDLALTQALVETVTLVVFVLVLRRLPTRIAERNQPRHRLSRALIGILVGVVMAGIAVIALGSRIEETIALQLPQMAVEIGHGHNVVNVMLVDIRAWDTMGEISVLVAVATGVASLIFVTGRTGSAPRLKASKDRRVRRRVATPVVEPVTSIATMTLGAGEFSAGSDTRPTRRSWLLAGRTLSAASRSILLEVLVRLLFHPVIIVSLFLLFSGHNTPGGGFAGGLLAGLALVTRYLAGGRFELGEAAPIDAGKVLGAGIILAAGTAVSSLVFGLQVLESSWFEYTIEGFITISIGTSTIFDIGVYLVVLGVVLDILRSLGAEIDRHQDELLSGATRNGNGSSDSDSNSTDRDDSAGSADSPRHQSEVER